MIIPPIQKYNTNYTKEVIVLANIFWGIGFVAWLKFMPAIKEF